jgi:drug/metabolite transporter (DMT)-like permease
MTLLLYAVAVVIWGTTWYAMLFQLGEVAPAASLTYRYLGAGAMLLLGAWVAGKRVRLSWPEHRRCAAQGALMFSIGYWLTYNAAAHLTTGIIALMFSSASAVTMVMSAVVARALPRPRALLGALCGVAGVGLVFWPEVAGVAVDGPETRAGLMVALSVLLFSAGGLVGARNQATGMPRFATIGWAMVYGGLVLAGLTLLRGERFGFEWTAPYMASLLYLTVLGSGAVFVLYFTVVERIGAERASYATVMFPLVALAVSTVAEGYRWPALALLGVPLALLGNALVLTGGRVPGPAGADLPPTGGSRPGEPQPRERPGVVEVPKPGARP